MTTAKQLFLLRHGQTAARGRYIGSTDLPLAPEGERGVEQIASLLRQKEFDAIYCSPMLRCRQTLDILALEQTSHICEELREIDFGRWEGLTFAEICEQDGEIVDSWSRWSEDFSFPQGESLRDFLNRIMQIKKKIAEGPAEKLLLVTHGGVIRHLICSCLGLAPEKYLLFDVQPGLFAVVDLYRDGGILAGLNQGGN
jgi:broad specificity phosphatase PhoE